MKKKLIVTFMMITLAVSLCACTDANETGKVKELMVTDITINAFDMNEKERAVKNALETAELAKTDANELTVETETPAVESETTVIAKGVTSLDMAATDEKSDKKAVTTENETGSVANETAGKNTEKSIAETRANNEVTATKPAETAKNEPAPTPAQPAQEYTPTITMNGNETNVTNWTDEQKQAHDQNTLDAIGDAIVTSGAEAGNNVATDMGLTGSCTMQ